MTTHLGGGARAHGSEVGLGGARAWRYGSEPGLDGGSRQGSARLSDDDELEDDELEGEGGGSF